MKSHTATVVYVNNVISISDNEDVDDIIILHLDGNKTIAVDGIKCDILVGANGKVTILTKEV